jgi:hypothetical protein
MKLEFLRRIADRAVVVARLAGPLLLLPACSEGPYLMSEEYLTREGQAEEFMGGGCMSVQEGGGMAGGTAPTLGDGGESGQEHPGFSFGYEGTGNSVHFYVTDGYGETLADRDYDSDFLLSGQREEITVDITNGKMRFVHWGGAKCEEVRAPDGG